MLFFSCTVWIVEHCSVKKRLSSLAEKRDLRRKQLCGMARSVAHNPWPHSCKIKNLL